MKISKILNDELRLRKSKNQRYSMRSFARFLGIDSTALSRILNEERLPSPRTSLKILKAMDLWTPDNTARLKANAKNLRSRHRDLLMNSFENDLFETLFEAHHIYVLTSLCLNGLSKSRLISHLSKNCGISEVRFKQVTEDLKAIGAIIEEDRKLKVVYKNKSTIPLPFTSEKRKKLQQEFLALASEAIDNFSMEERDNSTLTVAISRQDLPKIRKVLRESHIKINRISESRKVRDAVYNICLAAYPVLK